MTGMTSTRTDATPRSLYEVAGLGGDQRQTKSQKFRFPFVLSPSSLSAERAPYSGHGKIDEEIPRPHWFRGSAAVSVRGRSPFRRGFRLGEAAGIRGGAVRHRDPAPDRLQGRQ